LNIVKIVYNLHGNQICVRIFFFAQILRRFIVELYRIREIVMMLNKNLFYTNEQSQYHFLSSYCIKVMWSSWTWIYQWWYSFTLHTHSILFENNA